MDAPPPDFPDNPADQPADQPDPSPPASHLGWYRFALMITGHPETAATVLKESFKALGERLVRLNTPAARRAWMVTRLRKEAKEATRGEKKSESPWGKSAALPEPARTAYALFQSLQGELLDQTELAELTGCRSPAALATALSAARTALNPAAIFPSDSLLPLHSPWQEDTPAVATAVRAAIEKTPDALDAQTKLDEEWQTTLQAVSLPEGLDLPSLAALPKATPQLFRHPAVLAVGIAMLVMLGAVFFIAKQRMEEFPGKELINTLLDESSESGDQALEPIEPIEAERLADWFLLKGFDDYAAPEELRRIKAEACRVYQSEGVMVAHVALEPRRAELFVYHSSRLKPRVESRTWLMFQQDDWAVATRSDDELTYVVAFPGDVSDMPQFLKDGR